MATIRDVVFDSRQPFTLARFWADALDEYRIVPDDETELTRLRTIRTDEATNDPAVLVESATGAGLRIWFRRVPEPKVLKNRIHLDLGAADPSIELERLLKLGAVKPAEQPWDDGWCLLDPEGNEFCLCRRPKST